MIKQELEYKVLRLIERQPDLTQRQLSQKLGISLGKTHYVVKSLVDVGWIKLGNFKRSKNKLGYMYLLTPQGIVEKTAITARFLARKQREYNALKEEIRLLRQELERQCWEKKPNDPHQTPNKADNSGIIGDDL